MLNSVIGDGSVDPEMADLSAFAESSSKTPHDGSADRRAEGGFDGIRTEGCETRKAERSFL